MLLTRPEPAASEVSLRLVSLGAEVLSEPLLIVRPLECKAMDWELEGVRTLIFTSANAVRCLSGLTDVRNKLVLAVGDRTAQEALNHGFADVVSVSGAGEDLVRHVRSAYTPRSGTFLHVRGEEIACDVEALLSACGYDIRSRIVYRTEKAQTFSSACLEALANGKITDALFFSPGAARTFCDLVDRYGHASSLCSINSLCLGPRVVKSVEGKSWRCVRVADRPDLDSVLDLLGVSASPEHRVFPG